MCQTKDERVTKLAGELVDLARRHSIRHEAFDALDIAKILFRPALPPRTNSLDNSENLAGSEVDPQYHQVV